MTRTVKPYVPREFRVALTDRLRDAALLIPPTAPAEPAGLDPPPPAATDPEDTPPNGVPAVPTDLWETEIGRRMTADRAAIEATLEAVRSGVADLRRQHADRLHQMQRAAIELGLNIAAKLLHERVTADEFPVEAMVRDMAGEMHDDEVVTVRLNPADLALLERRLDGAPLLAGAADPLVVADPTLGRAECRLEGRASVSLSDVARQLTQIRDDLLRSLTDARP